MPEISDDDLGLLVWSAMDWDRRLPAGRVPDRIWEKLAPEWRSRINTWKGRGLDVLGAEPRPCRG